MKGPREPRRGRSRVIQFRCLSPSTRSAGVSRPPPPTGSHTGQAAPHRASFPGPLEHIMRGACRCSAQLRAHWLSPPQSLSRVTPPLLSAQGLVIISWTTSRSGTWRASFSSAKWPPPTPFKSVGLHSPEFPSGISDMGKSPPWQVVEDSGQTTPPGPHRCPCPPFSGEGRQSECTCPYPASSTLGLSQYKYI